MYYTSPPHECYRKSLARSVRTREEIFRPAVFSLVRTRWAYRWIYRDPLVPLCRLEAQRLVGDLEDMVALLELFDHWQVLVVPLGETWLTDLIETVGSVYRRIRATFCMAGHGDTRVSYVSMVNGHRYYCPTICVILRHSVDTAFVRIVNLLPRV